MEFKPSVSPHPGPGAASLSAGGAAVPAPPPFVLAVVAGGFASATVDVTIYPLDTLKTRLQAPAGFGRSGGFRRLFAGVGPTAFGSVPGGAIFFGVYEQAKLRLTPGTGGVLEPPAFNGASPASSAHWSCDAAAAVLAATASCIVRTPTAVIAQRMQIGQYATVTDAMHGVASGRAGGAAAASRGGLAAFYTGLGVSVARELPFAIVQFPLYEALKRLIVARRAAEPDGDAISFSAMEGAASGSFAGAMAAAVTTPFDVVKTRLMVGANAGAAGALRQVVAEGALFSGMGPRVSWMAIGGFIFFGVYERCLQLLQALTTPNAMRKGEKGRGEEGRGKERRGEEGLAALGSGGMVARAAGSIPEGGAARAAASSIPDGGGAAAGIPEGAGRLAAGAQPGRIPEGGRRDAAMADCPVRSRDTLLAGGLAGMATDAILHPIDTIKTRLIHGRPLSSPSLWSGISVAIMPAIPAAATFFTVYETAKRSAARGLGCESTAAMPCVMAAALAEGFSCFVRVPFEQLKMRMQASRHVSIPTLFKTRGARGALRQLYRGLPATLALDLPFALIQLPTFEALKRTIGIERLRRYPSLPGADSGSVLDDALAGAGAGGIAAALTTPLDVVRTRHVLRAAAPVHTPPVHTPPVHIPPAGRTPTPASAAGRAACPSPPCGAAAAAADVSFIGTARLIFRNEGARGLLRGLLPRTVYMGLGGILYLGTYSMAARRLSAGADRDA